MLILSVLLIFTACSSKDSDTPVSRKKPAVTSPAQPLTSSIFGRNTSYNAYTPAEGLDLPIPSTEILDMVQVEERLYFLGDGAVHRLDIETGEAARLFDTDATMFASHGDSIYTYTPEIALLSSCDANGNAIDSRTLSLEECKEIRKLIITENRVVVHCLAEIKGMLTHQYQIFDKATLEPVKTVNEKSGTGGASPNISVRAYKGDLLLVSKPDSYSDGVVLNSLDLDTGKSTKLIKLSQTKAFDSFDFVYNLKTDTVIVYSAPLSTSMNPEESAPPYYISEYSLSDPDNVVLQKYYLDNSVEASVFVTVYENIISAVSGADNSYRYYDFLNPPKSITVIGNQMLDGDVINLYEKETGILVRTVDYDTDYERLDLKLMAGDKDFDLFCPVSFNVYKYINTNIYAALNDYSGLKSRLSNSPLSDVLANNVGEYFAVPLNGGYTYAKEAYPDTMIDPDGNEVESPWSFTRFVTQGQYCARNIDALTGTYNDPDGGELYKVLKYLSGNPRGKKPLFGDEFMVDGEFCCLSCDYLMMNPVSEKKEDSVKFLEHIFDAKSGTYMELKNGETYLPFWRIMPADYMDPLYGAFNAACEEGVSQSELKKLAKKAAAEVAMRIGE